MKPLYKDYKGFTLLELVIVLALIGIVFSLAPALNLFGIKAFAKSENKSNVQFDARMAADFITREVRYASKVEILTSAPSTFDDDYCYIYSDLSADPQVIKYKDKNGFKIIASFTSLTGLNFKTADHKVLKYNIDGVYKRESFSIESEVVPLNKSKSDNFVNATGIAIKFKKQISTSTESLALEGSPSYAIVNVPYSYTFSAIGGIAPYEFSCPDDTITLPTGMTLDTSTGELSGTPTELGEFKFSITVKDSSSPQLSSTRAFTVNVATSLTAKMVAEAIDNSTYPFFDPNPEDTELVLPVIPEGFTVVIESSSKPSVVALNGDITKPTYNENVNIVLKVININDLTDPAWDTKSFIKIIPGTTANDVPQALNVLIENKIAPGVYSVGSTLTGSYTYLDADEDIQGASITNWYRSADKGYEVKEYLASGSTYRCIEDDKNNYIFFEVTPVAEAGVSPGETKLSEPVYISDNQKPVAKNIEIRNYATHAKVTKYENKMTLEAYYEYFDPEGDLQAIVEYEWLKANSVGGNMSHLGYGKTFYVSDNSSNYIYLQIKIKAQNGNVDIVTVTNAYVSKK